MLLEVSDYGTVRELSWNDAWWKQVTDKERELGRAICGSRVKAEDLAYRPCEAMPASRIGRCRKHYRIIETNKDIFTDPVYCSGARGLRVCGTGCPRIEGCEYYSEYFERRPAEVRPYCWYEVGVYFNQVKELLAEVEGNRVPVTQFVKNSIQTIAMGMVQIGRCDEELANGHVVLEEVQVWMNKGQTKETRIPVENPAIGARAKLMKAIQEASKSIMLPPKTRKELRNKGKDDDGDRGSPMERAGRLLESAGQLEAKK